MLWRMVNWTAFIVFYLWLLFFVSLGSTYEYDWMLSDPEFDGNRCRLHLAMLDNDYDEQRKTVYLLFLAQLIGIGFIFLRQRHLVFIISLALLFIYASWLLIVRDWLCLMT